MKRYIPVVFIIVAAILVFFLVGRNLFVKDVVSDCSQYCFLPMLVSVDGNINSLKVV